MMPPAVSEVCSTPRAAPIRSGGIDAVTSALLAATNPLTPPWTARRKTSCPTFRTKAESMLAQVAHFYDRDVEYNTKKLTTLLEPLLTAFLSVIVGFVVVSLYLPIFSLGKAIMHSN